MDSSATHDDVPAAASEARVSLKSLRAVRRVLGLTRVRRATDVAQLLLLPLAVLMYVIGGYYLILAPGRLYSALVNENFVEFRSELYYVFGLSTTVLAIKVLRGYLRESCAVSMRHRLASSLHAMYVGKRSGERLGDAPPYFRLADGHVVDNPDQRIVADAQRFSSSTFDIGFGASAMGGDSGGLLEATGSILWYTLKTLQRTGWLGVLVAYTWSFIVAGVTTRVINATSKWNFRQEELEGRLRYGHASLRTNAEPVAFLRGGSFERQHLDEMLNDVISNARIVIHRHIYLNTVQYGFGYYVTTVMYGTLGFAVFSSIVPESGLGFSPEMSPGDKAKWISQTAGVFMQLLFSFTTVIQLGTLVSEFVSNATRLAQLVDALGDDADSRAIRAERISSPDADRVDRESLLKNDDNAWGFGGRRSRDYDADDEDTGVQLVDAVLPLGESGSLGPISMTVRRGERVLLSGRSGSGKSTILRTIRGLQPPIRGTVHVDARPSDVAFLPQTPYLSGRSSTSLRHIVLYPSTPTFSTSETERVVQALTRCGWRRTALTTAELDRTDTDWNAQLSPGEAQVVCAARVLFAQPRYAILDEPTSSLDAATERTVLQALKQENIGILVTGHRDAVRKFCTRQVNVDKIPKDSQPLETREQA